MIYATIGMVVLIGFAILAVDVGRVQLAKSQLQGAADAAARYAAAGAATSSSPDLTARAHALAVISDATVDGGKLDAADVTVSTGTWNEGTRTFTPGTMDPNAVKVDLVYRFTGASNRPSLFAQALSTGRGTTTVIRASSIALAEVGRTELFPPASGNLWLADAAPGTVNRNFRPDAPHVWDYAGSAASPLQSPLEIDLDALNLKPGDALSFEGISGTARWVTGGASNSADGDSSYIVALGKTRPSTLPTNSYNGMSNTRAPIGAVMAVFVTDDPPSSSTAPSALDFQTAAQRDYSTISPALRQVFFVGDGKRSNGEVQRIIVPAGAKRVFVGMMDAWQWNDNVGNFKFNVYGRKRLLTVK